MGILGSLRQGGTAGLILLAALFFGFSTELRAGEDKAVPGSRDEIMLSFAPVVKKAAPAVVNIFTKRQVVEPGFRSPLFDDPLFKRFFGNSFSNGPRKRIERSLGSGVIVDPGGLVVTNHHVIEGASEITVVLLDRREFEAVVVISDERTDLALLAIDAAVDDLPTLTLKDSDEVEVGDLVLALGNPFGVGQTVTSGIVSALGRTQVNITDFSSFIQTDAAINPGNSGGALITLDGELVGINTAIFSRSGGSIGIGFAIPANMVRTVVAAAETGRLVRAWTGLAGQPVTADLAEGLGLDRPGGVIVRKVYNGGPADRAGITTGDIILSFNGNRVDDEEALRFRTATGQIGATGELEVLQDGEVRKVAMTLEGPPEEPARSQTVLRGQNPLAGAVVANLSPALAEELELPGLWSGVVVLDVKSGSPAKRLRFREGDLLRAVNGKGLSSTEELQVLLQALGSQSSWKLTVERNGKVHQFNVR